MSIISSKFYLTPRKLYMTLLLNSVNCSLHYKLLELKSLESKIERLSIYTKIMYIRLSSPWRRTRVRDLPSDETQKRNQQQI
jgi:hypothetical protein